VERAADKKKTRVVLSLKSVHKVAIYFIGIVKSGTHRANASHLLFFCVKEIQIIILGFRVTKNSSKRNPK
jgi:hypothetical membrane protein